MLTLAATIEGFQPPPGLPATRKHGALALTASGMGGIKPCISNFGADQFDEADATEAKKYFSNWFYLAINLGAVLGIGVVVFLV